MADASGGIATGLYWVITGKMPVEDLKDEDLKEQAKDTPKDPQDEKDKKGR